MPPYEGVAAFVVGCLFFISGPLGAWGWTWFHHYPRSEVLLAPGAYLILLTLHHPMALRLFLLVPLLYPLAMINLNHAPDIFPEHNNSYGISWTVAGNSRTSLLEVNLSWYKPNNHPWDMGYPGYAVKFHWIGATVLGAMLVVACLHTMFVVKDEELRPRVWLITRGYFLTHAGLLYLIGLQIPYVLNTGKLPDNQSPWVWCSASVLVTPKVRTALVDGVCAKAALANPGSASGNLV